MRPASQRFFIHSCIYLRIFISYLATFLGTNSLAVLMLHVLYSISIHFRFGRAHHDEMSILAPLYQCCTVRLSTVKTLLDLQTSPSSSPSSSLSGGGRLSDRMRRSLSSDPLSPVLSDAHLEALDRRVGIVLDQIHQCLRRSDGSRPVIVNH